MMSDMKITISEIVDDVVWLQFEHEGKPIYKVPLAQAIRDYIEPQYREDVFRGDGFNTEQAFKKLAIDKALQSELHRA